MAYSAGDILLIAEGGLPSNEVWANTWAVRLGTADYQDAADAVAGFYNSTDIDDIMHTGWSFTSLTVRDLFNQTSPAVSFTPNTAGGENSTDPLPTECAIRVSLSSLQQRGGPFLGGFTAFSLATNGQLVGASRDNIVDAVEAMAAALDTAGGELALHLPTSQLVVSLVSARVGSTFDVIRRRRNNVPENYAMATLP